MPRYANVRARELRRLLVRMGFVETAHNEHWRYRHSGLGLHTKVSFGNHEIRARFMGEIITKQLRITVDEFREAMNGNIPERVTNSEFWNK